MEGKPVGKSPSRISDLPRSLPSLKFHSSCVIFWLRPARNIELNSIEFDWIDQAAIHPGLRRPQTCQNGMSNSSCIGKMKHVLVFFLRSKLVDCKVRECHDLPLQVCHQLLGYDTHHMYDTRGRLVSPGSSSSKGTSSTGLIQRSNDVESDVGSWSIVMTWLNQKSPTMHHKFARWRGPGLWIRDVQQPCRCLWPPNMCVQYRQSIWIVQWHSASPKCLEQCANKMHTWYISRKSHETAHTRLNTSSACHPMAHPNRPAKHGYYHHEPWQVSQHHKFWEHQISSILLSNIWISAVCISYHFLPPRWLHRPAKASMNKTEVTSGSCGLLWMATQNICKCINSIQFQCPQRDLPDHCHQRPGTSWYNWCTWGMALLGSARCVSGCMYSLPFNMICLVRIMWFLSATAAKNMHVPIAFLAFLG